jgi:hypothetical protein
MTGHVYVNTPPTRDIFKYGLKSILHMPVIEPSTVHYQYWIALTVRHRMDVAIW